MIQCKPTLWEEIEMGRRRYDEPKFRGAYGSGSDCPLLTEEETEEILFNPTPADQKLVERMRARPRPWETEEAETKKKQTP